MIRSHHAGTVGTEDIGSEIVVAGWVQKRRDHGGIAFLDVRDGSGLLQVVADPAEHPQVGDLKMEYCVRVRGVVRHRPEGTENPELETGLVELGATELDVLAPSKTLPFMIDDRVEVDEKVRLRHRYLDLRRPRMAANLRARSKATAAIRRTLDELGFLEVETPTLMNSTPEGARDMLVPSRLRQGEFYALPQSPQLFKQLLMISGGTSRSHGAIATRTSVRIVNSSSRNSTSKERSGVRTTCWPPSSRSWQRSLPTSGVSRSPCRFRA